MRKTIRTASNIFLAMLPVQICSFFVEHDLNELVELPVSAYFVLIHFTFWKMDF